MKLTLAILGAVIGLQQAHAHPLQAEPINHPFVYTFDQFNVPEDPDDTLINGGLLLMAELRCTACHAAPTAWADSLKPAPGPDLSGVGSRLDGDTLWLLVRSPQHRKRGTLMPALFGNQDGDDEKIEALVSYLSTLKKEVPPMPTGNAITGKQLYHSIGCVACHQPASDSRPPRAEPGTEVERPGNASLPMALADAYDLHALGRFLLNPLDYRPSGRMPSQHLSEQEAADIAAYLHQGRAVEKAPERAALQTPSQSPAGGERLFTEMRCANCHRQTSTKPAKPLAKLKPSGPGCLANTPPPGTARYGLNALQTRAISLALKTLQSSAPQPATAHQRIDWQMTRLNCYACHDRDGKGGPEDPRAAYFVKPDSDASISPLPPSLDAVGRKYSAPQLHRILTQPLPPQMKHLTVRMPTFGLDNILPLVTDFPVADKE